MPDFELRFCLIWGSGILSTFQMMFYHSNEFDRREIDGNNQRRGERIEAVDLSRFYICSKPDSKVLRIDYKDTDC